ncbi:MAG: ABC transporter permease [Thermoflexales bacterium]|nr:ABC transporter permease [Thermoflexales bacterium]MCS7325266.1 ABC transporter permease [Thermoflexales bacterium]MCX7939802.1 ABC transporter permease [Thermoflexales bacterium]MDW8292139.1 ABC transporter permease [Anaerolineae bacterium]
MESTVPLSFDRAAARKVVQAERRRSTLIDVGVTLATIFAALLMGFVVIALLGKDPVRAYEALLTGPLTRLGRTGRWLELATNLILVGLGVSIAFRARQFSLGGQGQMVAGAIVAALIAIYVPLPPLLGVLLPIAAAMATGFLLGLLPGAMKAYLNANEIVSTLMLNAIVLRLYDYILTFHLKPQGSETTRSLPVQPTAQLPTFYELLGVDLGRFNLGVVLVIVGAVGVWLLLERTPFGFAIRTIGANEKFARYGGIDTRRVIMLAFAAGGAVSALAGVHLLLGVHRRLFLDFVGNIGWDGITVALLARNNPLLVPLSGLFYAYLLVGGDRVEQQAQVGSELVQVIQAVIILLITAQVLGDWIRAWRARAQVEV